MAVRIIGPHDIEQSAPERWGVARFGITEAIIAVVSTVTEALAGASAAVGGAIASGAGALGIGAGTAATIGTIGGELLVGGAVGGALGAGEAAITGGNVLKGFESGAVTGGVLGAGGPLLEEAGLGVAGADILAGAAGGALGAEATGASPVKGALGGAASGALASALPTGPSAGATTGGTPGAATPAPAGVPATGGDVSALPGNVLDPNTPLQVSSGGLSATATVPAASLPSGTSTATTGTAAPVGSNVSANVPGQLGTGAAAGGAPSNVTGSLSLESVSPTQFTTADLTAPTLPNISAPTGGASVADDFLSRNKDWLIPAGLTGAEALMGQQKPPFYNQLQTEAKTLGASGEEMMAYLKEGRLPPGLQANVDLAANAAKASIRSMWAQRTGNNITSAEAQDIANVDAAATSQGAQIALQLFKAGLDETQLSEQLYMQLMNIATAQDQELGNAITGFASSVALAGRPVNVLGASA